MEYLEKSLETANDIYLDNGKFTKAKNFSYPNHEFLGLIKWDKMEWLT